MPSIKNSKYGPKRPSKFAKIPTSRDELLSYNGKTKLFLGVWILFQGIAFILGALNYGLSENWAPAKKVLGGSFVVSRTSALLIHINLIVILLPMCRTILTALRGTRLSRIIPFDEAISFHKFVGWTIVFFSFLHTIPHYRNYYILASATASTYSRSVTKQFFILLVTSGPSWTGHIMLLLLMFISVPALERFRRNNFNRFFYFHHLFFVFLFLFSIHGAFCLLKPSQPPYCSRGSAFWKYYLFSGVLYLFERVVRELRCSPLSKYVGDSSSRFTGTISKVILHPSRVVEIQMQKDSNSEFKAGQYVYLNCPAVSLDQWHPFTLTSAPEENFYSVHMKIVGDWTTALSSTLGIDELSTEFEKVDQPLLNNPYHFPNSSTKTLTSPIISKTQTNRQSLMLKINKFSLPKLIIDGPFGSASEEVFCHDVAILVGAGIGVTPFASILKSIWYRYNVPGKFSSLQKVYFIWVQRETQSFEWFQDLLLAIEEEEIVEFGPLTINNGKSKNPNIFIEFQIYLTEKFNKVQVGNVIFNDNEGFKDVITNLKSPTYYGRPNFDSILGSVASNHDGADVGVFFCGPGQMGQDIENSIKKWAINNQKNETTFSFKKENF
ncbi:hypothetical protein BB560_002277 [Smittium megazygosporum]|uniref:FAD-binding FR-type domain-containing protein n=1 Tax=Smittium megazygosporum TaxID=133381 RepID=A0A2T9ZFE7_9FUNG|nr:hypothetical protein BB560_002277 [Smittium megazygosporum]